jgi:hypothetical protein
MNVPAPNTEICCTVLFIKKIRFWKLFEADEILNLPNPSSHARPWGLLSL